MLYKCPTTAWYTNFFFQFNSQENLQEGRSAQPRTSRVGGRSTYNPPPPPSIETWEFKKLCKIDIWGLAWNFVFYAITSYTLYYKHIHIKHYTIPIGFQKKNGWHTSLQLDWSSICSFRVYGPGTYYGLL